MKWLCEIQHLPLVSWGNSKIDAAHFFKIYINVAILLHL